MDFILIDFMLLILQKLGHSLFVEGHLNVVIGGVPGLAISGLVLAHFLGLRVVRDHRSAAVITLLANEAATLIDEVMGTATSHGCCPSLALRFVPSA